MGRADNFTYGGRRALLAYFKEYSESIDEPVKLDVIAICCDFTEYDDLKEVFEEYGWDWPTDCLDEEDEKEEALEELRGHTTVILIDDDESGDSGLIIQAF